MNLKEHYKQILLDEMRGARSVLFPPVQQRSFGEKLATAVSATALTAGAIGGAAAGKVTADAIYDPQNNPKLLEPVKDESGNIVMKKGGRRPVTPMYQIHSIAMPAGVVGGLGLGTGLVLGANALTTAIGERRRRNSPSQTIKEHFKNRILEQILPEKITKPNGFSNHYTVGRTRIPAKTSEVNATVSKPVKMVK